MQDSWLGSAWLAMGLNALTVWNAPRIWPLDHEAPDPESAQESPRDPLDITIFI